MSLRVMLVDDNGDFREAMRMFLENQKGIECTFEVAHADSVLASYTQCQVDIVIMDVNMQGVSGAELTRQILAYAPDARVVGLSGLSDWKSVAQMVSAGALGYVIKGSASDELLRAIRAAGQRKFYFDTYLKIRSADDLMSYGRP